MDFSIIVPTFNRPHELARCLRSLVAIDYALGAYEIVVVDDGGGANLRAVIDQMEPSEVHVRLLRQEDNRGPGAARNLGARAARGRWLAFTDDDCEAQPGWLAGFREVLERDGEVLVGGRTVNRLEANPFASTSQLIADAAYRFHNHDTANARFLASNNMGASRAAFLAADGFDESFRIASEDRELCDRWVWRGRRIVYTADAVIEHRHDLRLPSFLKQHYRYGRGAARFHRVREARGSATLLADTLFRWRWRELVVTPALAAAHPIRTLALLCCWQAANTAGFIRESVGQVLGEVK
jgi:GT2 family glycosyltransferase